jgi:hypothetical protein
MLASIVTNYVLALWVQRHRGQDNAVWEPVIRRERKPCKGVTRCKRLRVPPLQGWCTPHRNSQALPWAIGLVPPLGRQFPLTDWHGA